MFIHVQTQQQKVKDKTYSTLEYGTFCVVSRFFRIYLQKTSIGNKHSKTLQLQRILYDLLRVNVYNCKFKK